MLLPKKKLIQINGENSTENMFLPNLEHIFSQPMPKKILVLSSPNTSFSASTTSGKGCGGVDR
jgi:hypothetical protein